MNSLLGCFIVESDNMKLTPNETNREALIETIGVYATDLIENLRADIDAIHEYLGVVRVYDTKGFSLRENKAKIDKAG